jgi:alpha-L-fucosidase
MEYYMFVHFGPNTFTDVEWGDGKEDPRVFNPTDLDCRQWAATARAAGMQGIIITAKHHDGFCLWPSNYSTHTVRESLWKEGKGDILRELSDACREYGLKFGVYLSPWDQNHPAYGTDGYNEVFANTLNEVLSDYGPVFEQWFDGANGHANSGVKLPPYDWPMFHEVVYRNQPHAIIFSDVGPGCRWMGNERGVAGETNWSTMNIEGFTPGLGAPPTSVLNSGRQGGQAWVPAETDVSIRPGWFYSPATDERVKTTDKLMDIWYTSVGRNSNLLLNVPPDRRGRIHPNDSLRLMEFRAAREEAFAENLAAEAAVTASATRGGSSKYAAANVLDGDYDTYWTTDDGVTSAWLEIDLGTEKRFNRLLLAEYIPLGQRVVSFNVEYPDAATGNWIPLTAATTIGYKRILRFPAVTAQKIRIGFEAQAAPVISAAAIYNSPELLSLPAGETYTVAGTGIVTK